MRVRTVVKSLSTLIFSQTLTSGCTLSNRVEDIKVLCGLKDVNPDRICSPAQPRSGTAYRAGSRQYNG
jgi:hypothetical protein